GEGIRIGDESVPVNLRSALFAFANASDLADIAAHSAFAQKGGCAATGGASRLSADWPSHAKNIQSLPVNRGNENIRARSNTPVARPTLMSALPPKADID